MRAGIQRPTPSKIGLYRRKLPGKPLFPKILLSASCIPGKFRQLWKHVGTVIDGPLKWQPRTGELTMKSSLAISVGTLALLGLFGVTIAEMQNARKDQAARHEAHPIREKNIPNEGRATALTQIQPARDSQLVRAENRHPRDTDPRRARGLYVRPDGMTVGRVHYIDRNTLNLVPVADARITFLQHRRIIAQGVTDEQGVFAVPGLTPWAVYSVAAASEDWVGMFSAVIRPYDHHDDHPHRGPQTAPTPVPAVGKAPGWLNEIRFVSMNLEENGPQDSEADQQQPDDSAEDEDAPESPSDSAPLTVFEEAEQDPVVFDGTVEDYLDYEFHEFQLMPREDFIAALRAGVFGSDVCGLPPGGMMCCPGTGAGGAGGGGGAGGSLGGLGAGLLGAGIGAAIGAGTGSSGGLTPASPFEP
jgi:hypothetical protein